MQLYEQGLFKMWDPVSEYLPGFIAERYTESLDEVTGRLRTRIAQSAVGEAKGKIGLSKSEEDDEEAPNA